MVFPFQIYSITNWSKMTLKPWSFEAKIGQSLVLEEMNGVKRGIQNVQP